MDKFVPVRNISFEDQSSTLSTCFAIKVLVYASPIIVNKIYYCIYQIGNTSTYSKQRYTNSLC